MKLKVIQNNESKQIIVKMMDKNNLLCFEYGSNPTEILNKINTRISVSKNQDTLKMWTKFKELFCEFPKREFYK